MKNGDEVFVHHAKGVHLYCSVKRVTADEMLLDVINGGYELRITKATPPPGIRDYNEAITWFDGQRKKT